MWKTSGSGLPTGNKKNSFKEIHVGFLWCGGKSGGNGTDEQ